MTPLGCTSRSAEVKVAREVADDTSREYLQARFIVLQRALWSDVGLVGLAGLEPASEWPERT